MDHTWPQIEVLAILGCSNNSKQNVCSRYNAENLNPIDLATKAFFLLANRRTQGDERTQPKIAYVYEVVLNKMFKLTT